MLKEDFEGLAAWGIYKRQLMESESLSSAQHLEDSELNSEAKLFIYIWNNLQKFFSLLSRNKNSH